MPKKNKQSDLSLDLFNLEDFWFYTDHHLRNGRAFKYHQAQQEAVETLIYLYEVAYILLFCKIIHIG